MDKSGFLLSAERWIVVLFDLFLRDTVSSLLLTRQERIF